jgi:hypothetical protein
LATQDVKVVLNFRVEVHTFYEGKSVVRRTARPGTLEPGLMGVVVLLRGILTVQLLLSSKDVELTLVHGLDWRHWQVWIQAAAKHNLAVRNTNASVGCCVLRFQTSRGYAFL